MKNNFFIRFIIFTLTFFIFTIGVSANPAEKAVSDITNRPTTQVRKTSDGSTSRISTIPWNTNYSAWNITKPDGTSIHVVNYTDTTSWKTTTVITRPDGSTATATRDKDGTYSGDKEAIDAASGIEKWKDQIDSITSEKVPGADCVCHENADCTKVETRKYRCTTGTGLAGFQVVFAKLIRFVVNMTLLLWVFAVAWLGIAWTFAGADDIKAKSTLKTWAINIIVWLVVLFLFREILLFLAPWVYQ